MADTSASRSRGSVSAIDRATWWDRLWQPFWMLPMLLTVAAVVLDRACRQQLLTQGYDGEPSWSDAEESLAKREHIYGGRARHQVWDYLVRRLPPL